MIRVINFLPIAPFTGIAVQLSTTAICRVIVPHQGTLCNAIGIVFHEVSEVLTNVIIGNMHDENSIPENQNKGEHSFSLLDGLTLKSFTIKALASFGTCHIVENYFIPEQVAEWAKLLLVGLAGTLGAQIPDWFENLGNN